MKKIKTRTADPLPKEKRSTTESTKIPRDLATFREIAEIVLKRQQNFRLFGGSHR